MQYPKIRNSRPVQGNIDREESRDVYLNDEPPSEPARCPVCGNVYENKRWYRYDQRSLDNPEGAQVYTCPGCSKVQDGYYYGELTLRGGFVVDHFNEISNLIQNEVDRTQKKNPLSKLVEIESEDGGLHLRTTNSKLAERIGRKLENSYQGELEIDKSDYITRVDWSRE